MEPHYSGTILRRTLWNGCIYSGGLNFRSFQFTTFGLCHGNCNFVLFQCNCSSFQLHFWKRIQNLLLFRLRSGQFLHIHLVPSYVLLCSASEFSVEDLWIAGLVLEPSSPVFVSCDLRLLQNGCCSQQVQHFFADVISNRRLDSQYLTNSGWRDSLHLSRNWQELLVLFRL